MLGALIIVFREVIEAGLIVGIVLAVTKGVHGSRATIVAGVAAGVVGASLVAAFAGVIADALAGVGQEIFNASILLVAVAMLIWHNVWMASHGRELAANVKRVGDAVQDRLAAPSSRSALSAPSPSCARGPRSRSSCTGSSPRGARRPRNS